MKTDKNSLILGLVIGIVIGGVAMGILDAKRPKPLFSSADSNIETSYELETTFLEEDPSYPESSISAFPCIRCRVIEGVGLKCTRVECPRPSRQ